MVLLENAKDCLHGQGNKQTSPNPCQPKQISFKKKIATIPFFGHIIRPQQLEYLAICRKICGKKARGRPSKTHLDQLKDWMNLNTPRTCTFPSIEKVEILPAHWLLCLVQVMDLHDDDDCVLWADILTATVNIHWDNFGSRNFGA